MKQIHKQHLEIPFGSHHTIHLPGGATILHVDVQETVPTIWYEFEYESGHDVPYEERTFVVRGTGRGWDNTAYVYEHVGTCLTRSKRIVYHVYEVLTKNSEDNDRD